jgi:hypothetical protein
VDCLHVVSYLHTFIFYALGNRRIKSRYTCLMLGFLEIIYDWKDTLLLPSPPQLPHALSLVFKYFSCVQKRVKSEWRISH